MVGRDQEKQIFNELLQSQKAELVTVVGRRRVGKTYLIRQYHKDYFAFDFIGTKNVSVENQLIKFADKLNEYSKSGLEISKPKNWADAFKSLKIYLQKLRKSKRKKVIFFDEMPWIASPKSGFLSEFEYWWNEWASEQPIVVILCGSAASWMLEKVVNNKDGLHNRVTQEIHLQPFTLAETHAFVKRINPAMDSYQILQLYMALGGIPHYLQHLKQGESATQAINRLCFERNGVLRKEFDNLYAALFEGYERHVKVVRALSTKWRGLTRNEIIRLAGLSDGGGLTKILDQLEASSFILLVEPFGKKKKDTLYRLADEYSLFYLKFIEGLRAGKRNIWLQQSKEHNYTVWRGYAFENICIKHSDAIKMALGISGIHTQISSFKAMAQNGQKGIQVDMLIDRSDNTINLCEMKFYNDDWTMNKEDAQTLRRRRSRFQEISKTKKSIFNTVVTTYGVTHNEHSLGQVDQCVTMDKLFLIENF